MTASPEKAAPIPAEVRAIADAIAATWHLLSYPSKVVLSDDIARAILQDRADREARPSLPDSREERISEDVLDRLYAKAREDRDRAWPDPRAWDACEWLSEEGAMLPADRARARQGGNNG